MFEQTPIWNGFEWMSESTMRQRVVRALKRLHAVPVENPAWPGTPDVSYIGGWLELKWLRDWPIRKESVVKIEHFTQQQRVWLMEHHRRGGTCHVLLQCHQEWFLLDPIWAAENLGRVTQDAIRNNFSCYWEFGLDDLELLIMLDKRKQKKKGKEKQRDCNAINKR